MNFHWEFPKIFIISILILLTFRNQIKDMSITTALRPLYLKQRAATRKDPTHIPLYIYTVSFASLFIVVGLFWDISWHKSIGRDKLLSPPHLLIYLGGVLTGLTSGIQVLRNTFAPSEQIKKSAIKVWGFFYSSLGAMFCIWGAIAMLTSAPFDDWWHNTYGLDVVVLSPPHALLILGIFCLQLGSCVSISKYMNLMEANNTDNLSYKKSRILRFLFVLATASFLSTMFLFFQGFLDNRYQRLSFFYQVTSILILLFLPAFGAALRMKWGITTITFAYFLICNLCNWILQLFSAVPMLGPILNPVTHFQALQFPILFFIPAMAMDFVLQKFRRNNWLKAFLLSGIFILMLCLIQYPFSGFLLESPNARNWFFGSDSWLYSADPDWQYRYKFAPEEIQELPSFIKGMSIAVLFGAITSRVSIFIGSWMKKIVR